MTDLTRKRRVRLLRAYNRARREGRVMRAAWIGLAYDRLVEARTDEIMQALDDGETVAFEVEL
jgi:hypothetical protein